MALNSATIKSIQDIMRKDAGVDGDAQRLGQLTWLLFLKIFDDREQEWEITVKKYRSPIPEELRWRNWAADTEGLTGDGLLEFINNKLFPTLKGLRHAEGHYVKNGVPTSEIHILKSVIRPLKQLYGMTPAKDFGPLTLKAVRQKMVEVGWCRTTINAGMSRIHPRQSQSHRVTMSSVPCVGDTGTRTISGLAGCEFPS